MNLTPAFREPVDPSLPAAIAARMRELRSQYPTTVIADGMKRFSCCLVVVGRSRNHDWYECMSDALTRDPAALPHTQDPDPHAAANPPWSIKPSGEAAIKAWEKQGRRCDGDNNSCDQRATREQMIVNVDPATGEDTGVPTPHKTCARHAKQARAGNRRVLGFRMLGKTPDPTTGLMVDGCYTEAEA